MKKVSGYLADDGTFFDAEADVELYEALHALEFSVKNIGADPAKFMIVVEGCQDQLMRYLNAQSKFKRSEALGPVPRATGSSNPQPAVDHTNDRSAEGHAPVLEQSADEPEHVPDIRGSIGAEAVPDGRTIDGTGSGSTDARSVRGAAYMATVSSAAITAARRGSSDPFVRQAEARAKLSRSDV
jgi:hypothetical protein